MLNYDNLLPDISTKQWKQQIQFLLYGKDYQSLLYTTIDDIKIKPFYHPQEDISRIPTISRSNTSFIETIYASNWEKTKKTILLLIEQQNLCVRLILPTDFSFQKELIDVIKANSQTLFLLSIQVVSMEILFHFQQLSNTYLLFDPLHHLQKEGNWSMFSKESNEQWIKKNSNVIYINSSIYQNSGASTTQQLSYTLANLHQNISSYPNKSCTLLIEIGIGADFFVEIAKIKTLRWLISSYNSYFETNFSLKILATISDRYKTIYNNKHNSQLHQIAELAAIIGGVDWIENKSIDAFYKKSSLEYRLELLTKKTAFLKNNSWDNSAFLIDKLTEQLGEKSLTHFKQLLKKGDFVSHLIHGNIQKDILNSHQKEQQLWLNNFNQFLFSELENKWDIYPFVRKKIRKTLISPIIEKRIFEDKEQERKL